MNVTSLAWSATIGGAGFFWSIGGRIQGRPGMGTSAAGRQRRMLEGFLILVGRRSVIWNQGLGHDAGLTVLNPFPRRVIIGNVLDSEKRE